MEYQVEHAKCYPSILSISCCRCGVMLGRILFYPTLAFNVVMEKVSSRKWYTRIDTTAILGALPFKSMTDLVRVCCVVGYINFYSILLLQLVQKENVRGVITMNEQYETNYFCNNEQVGFRQCKLEI